MDVEEYSLTLCVVSFIVWSILSIFGSNSTRTTTTTDACTTITLPTASIQAQTGEVEIRERRKVRCKKAMGLDRATSCVPIQTISSNINNRPRPSLAKQHVTRSTHHHPSESAQEPNHLLSSTEDKARFYFKQRSNKRQASGVSANKEVTQSARDHPNQPAQLAECQQAQRKQRHIRPTQQQYSYQTSQQSQSTYCSLISKVDKVRENFLPDRAMVSHSSLKSSPACVMQQRSQPEDSDVQAVHKFLTQIEPNNEIREQDLIHLAKYLVKIGTDVTIATKAPKNKRLLKHRELDVSSIERVVTKYNLSWRRDCERKDFNENTNRALHHLTICYPLVFLRQAAYLSPGGYEERRFWYCANNAKYYEQHKFLISTTNHHHKKKFGSNSSLNSVPSCKVTQTTVPLTSSRLLSDVLYILLTPDEPKLIAINALHLSVKHSEPQIFSVWYDRKKAWLYEQIRLDKFGKRNSALKDKLRNEFAITKAENELQTVHVDFFIDYWNLTGLKRPSWD